MSGGTVCRCPESKKPLAARAWFVTARNSNRSAFNGYRETWSAWSAIRCAGCDCGWRTKAAYVKQLRAASPGWERAGVVS